MILMIITIFRCSIVEFKEMMKQMILTFDRGGWAAAGIKNWALPGNVEEAITVSNRDSRWKRDD
jgi:hypothetical protein